LFKKRLMQSLSKPRKTEPYSDQNSADDIELKERSIDKSLEKNIEVFQTIYSMPKNTDIKIRQLFIPSLNQQGALLYISSIIDTNTLDEHIIRPLLVRQDSSGKLENIVSTESVKNETKIKEILSEVNKGSCVLFVDGHNQSYIISIPKFETRSIGQPENEVSLRGPKEAFSEKALTNISLVRKKIRNENLVVESSTISKRSKNSLFMAYVKDLANEELIQKVKKRIDSLDDDSIQNLAILEQLIEDRPRSIFPTVLYTERPDRAAYFLEDGYVVMFMDNSPAALVVPATFWSFYHTSDDRFLRFFNGNFSRFIRILGLFITLFTSAIYVSVTNYHAEMVPPDLLLAMASNREKVPFPSFVEVILMELAFELIREAGLRVPSPIGPTIGIVGALILGQAAVQANIVSPIVVIVVALGGLSSFVIGDISMNFAIRINRFIIIVAAGFMGIYGMTAVFVAGLFYLVSIKSFGIPYLAPLTPRYTSSKDIIFRRLIRNEMFRPGYLRPKDIERKAGDS
jgi:spore germination protein KA